MEYRRLRVCERFGWQTEYVEAKSADDLTVLLAYCSIRDTEEARERAAMAGLRLR